MGLEFLERVVALRRGGVRFALATVVARRPPVSAHLGDHAIVFADGRMEGFVGGACAREIVRHQALEALRVRHARLVSIQPDASGASESTAEHVVVPMSCASEGAVDVYLEPFVQARSLIVVGGTPVADALSRLARGLDYDVVRVVDAREEADIQPHAEDRVRVVPLEKLEAALEQVSPDGAAVVASQGHYDEQALEVILRAAVPYVGLVASRKRGALVRAQLEEAGVPGVGSMRNPAGLDLGARTPAEVALSILAEIVQTSPSQAPTSADGPAPAALKATGTHAVDPVCSMQVEIATARHTVDVDGVTYYFCCAGCRSRFVKEPDAFRSARTP